MPNTQKRLRHNLTNAAGSASQQNHPTTGTNRHGFHPDKYLMQRRGAAKPFAAGNKDRQSRIGDGVAPRAARSGGQAEHGAPTRPSSRFSERMGYGFDGFERALQQLDRLAQRNVAVGVVRKVLSEPLDEQLRGLNGLLVAQNDIGHRSASFADRGP